MAGLSPPAGRWANSPPRRSSEGDDVESPVVKPKDGLLGRVVPRGAILVAAAAALIAPAYATAAPGPSTDGAAEPPYTARGSAEQVDVTGARPGQRLELVDRA